MSDSLVKLGFEQQTIELDLKNIVPLKVLTQAIRESRKFQQIIASIREVGVIEPLVVTKESASENRYMITADSQVGRLSAQPLIALSMILKPERLMSSLFIKLTA